MQKNKNILFIGILYSKRSPSQRFRYEQFIPLLEANGYECHLKWIINKEDELSFYKGSLLDKLFVFIKSTFRLIKIVISLEKYERIFIQREVYYLGTSFFEYLLSRKAPIIYDFDDSIWLPNISENNKKLAFLKNPNKTKQILKLAHSVIAGNQFLADYAVQFNQNITIIPTCVDTQKFKPSEHKSHQDKIIIGWSGSHTTIPHLELLLPTLEKIKLKFGDKIDFLVIGDPYFKYPALNIQGIAWSETSEVQNLSKIDIGIMPLPNDEWSKGKCGFKGIQYMAMEIPTIMSPVGVNTEIIQDNINGFLADSEEEWLEKLTLLIENPTMREKIGKMGRKTVVEKYSIDANKDTYLNVIASN
jgi:glycosyltransferase involved in cell wall biosynthesis